MGAERDNSGCVTILSAAINDSLQKHTCIPRISLHLTRAYICFTTSELKAKVKKYNKIIIKMIGEASFSGLTLKILLNWDMYWNKCTLYIKIEALLKHYYMYSTLFIEITQSV
jgi:hypothetical protein